MNLRDLSESLGALLEARPPKGTPTGTNAWAVYNMIKKVGYVPERVERVDHPHLKRVLVWGGLEKRKGGGFQLTPKGRKMLKSFGYDPDGGE